MGGSRLSPWCCLLVAPLAAGQTLHFVGEWRLIDAGRVQAHLGATGARMELQTSGLAERLFPVRDSYSVSYDHALCASSSVEDSQQGAKHREIKVTFGPGKAERVERDMVRNGETVAKAEVDVPGCVHDLLGALEKLRRTVMTPGGTITLPMSDGRKSAGVEIRAQEKETIRTRAGVFNAVRYEAMLFNGVIYRRKARLFLWLTDDARRLPVQIRVQMPLLMGTVTLQLEREEPG